MASAVLAHSGQATHLCATWSRALHCTTGILTGWQTSHPRCPLRTFRLLCIQSALARCQSDCSRNCSCPAVMQPPVASFTWHDKPYPGPGMASWDELSLAQPDILGRPALIRACTTCSSPLLGAAWPLTDTADGLLQKRRVLLTMLGEGDGRRSPEQLSKTANWWTDP